MPRGFGGSGVGRQGGCERRIEVIVKIQKEVGGGVRCGRRWGCREVRLGLVGW